MASITRISLDEVANTLQPAERPADLTDLDPFIRSANLVVTQELGSCVDLSTETLELVEQFLTCHFWIARTTRSGVNRVRIQEAEEAYSTSEDSARYGDLNSSRYGRIANALARNKLDSVGKPEALLFVL